MSRRTCKVSKCRRWKNINNNGFCSEHITAAADAVIEDEVCECFTCSTVVREDDMAINCELCDKWYHVKCTNVTVELYKQLDPEEGDPPLGLQWYCDTCLPVINQLISNHRAKRNNETQTANKNAQCDHVKLPICENYRHGTCEHGMSGKKEVNGDTCPFRHPRNCTKYCQFGYNPQFGCINTECRFLHPVLCHYSVRHRFCDNENCSYVHLKGTTRKKSDPDHIKYYGDSHKRNHPVWENRQQREHSAKGISQQRSRPRRGYSNFDPNKLGFNSFTTKHQENRIWQPSTQYHDDPNNNSQDYQYRQSDFPQFSSNHNIVTDPSSKNPAHTIPIDLTKENNITTGQNFLDLLQAVKSVQESQTVFQTKFETELQSLKNLITPLLPQQPQYNHPQNPNLQQQTQFFHPQSQPMTMMA